MRRWMKLIMLAAAVVACGGAPTTGGETRSCTLTLSGTINGTWDCRPATTTWHGSIDEGIFRFTVPQSASAPAIDVSIAWSGQPKARHYQSSDADAQATLTIAGTDRSWTLQAGRSYGGVTGGSYDLDFAGILSAGPYYIGEEYTTTGTLDATLYYAFASTPDLAMHVTF